MTAGPPPPDLLIGLWGVWIVIWMVAALGASRTVFAQPRASRVLHLGLIVVGAALVFLHFRVPRLLAQRVLPSVPGLGWGGLAATTLGILFAAWARIHLGRQWSGTVTLKQAHTLVRSGPYGLTRHPIYTGLLVAVLGSATVNGTVAACFGFGLITLACLLKIRLEERVLGRHFGAAYEDYRHEVNALIPFVW